MTCQPWKFVPLIFKMARRKRFALKFHLSRGIDVSGTHIDFAESIKLLGVVLDASLTFKKYMLDVVRGCHFYIRALRPSDQF